MTKVKHSGKYRRNFCCSCGRPASVAGQISWRGNCSVCASSNQIAAIYEMAYREGATWELWRRKMAESVGAELPTS